MQKIILFILCASFFHTAKAQSDLLVFKKGNHTVERYFNGSFISFQLNTQQWISGYIKKLQTDSITIVPIEEKLAINFLGMVVTDTLVLNTVKIALKNIYALPKGHEGFSYIKNGSLLQILSGGYMALNIINTASSKDPVFGRDNIKNLGIAAGVFAAGTIMHLTHHSYFVVGKKYHLQILLISSSS